jgi:hypothetical protein
LRPRVRPGREWSRRRPRKRRSASSPAVPFLRVIRDKRGYETTYLMHWFREGSRQHSRILYVFRTPGGVRVGRPPLEADVQRQIEARHPEIEFDWHTVLDNRQVIESAPPEQRRQPRKRKRSEDESTPAAAPAAAAPPKAENTQTQTPRFVVPARIEGDTPDAQIAFLAQWYGLIREQIEQRATEPGRREALLALVARLNPAAWTDADEITGGLAQAAEALERLSHVFAKRRRRSRRKKTDAPRSTDQDPTSTDLDPSSTDLDPSSIDQDPSSTDQ